MGTLDFDQRSSGETGSKGRDSVVDIGSIFNCHGPERWICSFGPVDGNMKKHSASHSHNSLDPSLRFPILVVTTGSGQLSGLSIVGKLVLESFGCKGSSIVRLVLLNDDAIVAGNQFKTMNRFKGFIGIQASLKFHMCKPGASINKDAAAFVSISVVPGVIR